MERKPAKQLWVITHPDRNLPIYVDLTERASGTILSLGRDSSNDIVLEDNQPYIARQYHCTFVKLGAKWYVEPSLRAEQEGRTYPLFLERAPGQRRAPVLRKMRLLDHMTLHIPGGCSCAEPPQKNRHVYQLVFIDTAETDVSAFSIQLDFDEETGALLRVGGPKKENTPITLSSQEDALFRLLYRRNKQNGGVATFVPMEDLLKAAFGQSNDYGSEDLQVPMKRLRKKLDSPDQPQSFIQNFHGRGYQLEMDLSLDDGAE
jgi:DNA-binding winged helix-turn-helix (wHTH) protein